MIRKRKKQAAAFLLPVILSALLFASCSILSGIERGRNGLVQTQLEEIVRKTALICYAAEGVYPPSLEYMEERYGLKYDKEEYEIWYSVFGSNLMPDITVLVKGEE